METLDKEHTGRLPILPIKQRWILLVIGVSISLVMVVFQFLQSFEIQELIERTRNGDTGAARMLLKSNKEGITPLTIVLFLVKVACIVFVCMWFYRASQNVHQAGINFMNHLPGWNVGWFFIPVAHIVMPVIAVREMVKASLSINNHDEYSSWQNNKVIPAFLLWSICYITFLFLIYAYMFYTMSFMREMMNNPGDTDILLRMLESQTFLSYITSSLIIVEGIALLLFSKKVTDLQETYRKEE